MPGDEPAGQMALFHREKGVVGLLVHSGTKRTGDQVLSLLQHAAGETVPVSQQAEITGNYLRILLQGQFSRPGTQLALQDHCITDLFHNITPVRHMVACPRFFKNGQLF